MNKILITGAAGFVGSALSENYLKRGLSVYGVDNFCSGQAEHIERLLKIYPQLFHFSDFDVTKSWSQLSLPSVDLAFHLASPASVPVYQRMNLETMWVNSIGLKNAIEFCDTSQARLVFASTSEVYGTPARSPQSETDWGQVNSYGPRSCYDEGKRFGEALIYNSNKRNGTQHGLVRIFNTFGPGMKPDDGRVVSQFIGQALRQEDLTVYGSGLQTRSLCFISDLVRGLASYAESGLVEPINLGNDQECSILDLAKLIIDLTGSKSKIIFSRLPEDDPPQRCPNLMRAKNLLAFKNEFSLPAGLKIMIEKMRVGMISTV